MMDYEVALDTYRRRELSWLDARVLRDEPEFMDLFPNSQAALTVARELDFFGRWSGLHWYLCRQIGRRLTALHREHDRPLRVIDLCTGRGGFARYLEAWLRQQRIPIELTAVDVSPTFIEAARTMSPESHIRWMVADAMRLPFSDGEYDLAINIQSLHHFRPDRLVALLREAFRVAPSLFVFDLRRSPYGFLLLKLLRPFFTAEFIHDGVASHRRAYSEHELRFLLQLAGLSASHRRSLFVGQIIERGPTGLLT